LFYEASRCIHKKDEINTSGVTEFFHFKLVIPAPACAKAGSGGNPEMPCGERWMPACTGMTVKAPIPLKYLRRVINHETIFAL
jgi:hypothetical protein